MGLLRESVNYAVLRNFLFHVGGERRATICLFIGPRFGIIFEFENPCIIVLKKKKNAVKIDDGALTLG